MNIYDKLEVVNGSKETYDSIVTVSKGMRGYYSFTTESTHKMYKGSKQVEMNDNERDVVNSLIYNGKKDIRLYNVRTGVKGYYITIAYYN